MKKKIQIPDGAKSFDGLTLINKEKLDRVIVGVVGREGKVYGGLGDQANPSDVLAQYDKLGGLILKNGNKVKTGCFWDFEKKCPKENPEIIFLFQDIEGNAVEVPEGTEVPIEVKAAEMVKESKGKKLKKPKKTIEDEE